MSSQAIFDKNLELRAPGTITASETGTAIVFQADAVEKARCVFEVTALDRTDGNETYVPSLEIGDGTNWAQIGALASLVSIATTGRFEIAFTGAQAAAIAAAAGVTGGASQIRHKMTLGGTTPSITFRAFLTKV